MTKRIAAAALWSLMVYSGWQLVTGLVTGSASLGTVGLIIGLVVGAVIAIDPRNVIWDQPTRRVYKFKEQPGFDAEPAISPRG